MDGRSESARLTNFVGYHLRSVLPNITICLLEGVHIPVQTHVCFVDFSSHVEHNLLFECNTIPCLTSVSSYLMDMEWNLEYLELLAPLLQVFIKFECVALCYECVLGPCNCSFCKLKLLKFLFNFQIDVFFFDKVLDRHKVVNVDNVRILALSYCCCILIDTDRLPDARYLVMTMEF